MHEPFLHLMQGSFRHYRPLYNRERIERPAVRADGLNPDRVLGRTRNQKGVRGVRRLSPGMCSGRR